MKFVKSIRALLVLSLRVLGAIVSALQVWLIIRVFEPGVAAQLLLVLSVSAMLSVVLRWGLDDIIVRVIARSAAAQTVTVVLKFARRRVVRLGVVATAFLLGATYMGFVGAREAVLAIIVGVVLAYSACYGRIFQGEGANAASLLLLVIAFPLIVCAGVLLLEIYGWNSVEAALTVFLIAAFASLLLAVRLNSRKTRTPCDDAREINREFDAANLVGFSVLAQQGAIWAISIVPALFFSPVVYSSFVLASKVGSAISFPGVVINFMHSRAMAQALQSASHSAARTLLMRCLAQVCAASVAVTSVFVVFLTIGGGADRHLQSDLLLLTALSFVPIAMIIPLSTALTLGGDSRYLTSAMMTAVTFSLLAITVAGMFERELLAVLSWGCIQLILTIVLLRRAFATFSLPS